MDTLKNYIDQNRDQFNDLTPPEGHEMRFAYKLGHTQKKRRSITTTTFLKIAAISVLTLLSSLYIFENMTNNKPEPILTLSEINQDYADVEFYFTSTTNNQLELIEKTLNGEPSMEKDLLMNELSSLDTLQLQLQKELNANPNDERVINAMLQYYQFKMKVLTQIIDRLKEMKTPKNHEYETTTI
ncbi:MAG: hypothetical protein PHU27_13050 [Salinivirgaceae bacterium]|nr:hypothetical protein [Salinivirgaceae bacterium]MDD4747992.1 hypothetical protein [Salinivirgaceae bacterium]